MIIRIIVKLFGGMWNLKKICNSTKNKFFKRILIKLYRLHNMLNGCSIAWNAQIEGVPNLPHGFHGIFIAATDPVRGSSSTESTNIPAVRTVPPSRSNLALLPTTRPISWNIVGKIKLSGYSLN